jgi:hypothetical protein
MFPSSVRRFFGSEEKSGRIRFGAVPHPWQVQSPTYVAVALLFAPLVVIPSGSVSSAHDSDTALTSPPPPAVQLATRLGLKGAPVVGASRYGQGGPWSVWLPRLIKKHWVARGNIPSRWLPPTGPSLFVGPLGAKGEFHYFDDRLLRLGTASGGPDTYKGPRLSRRRVEQIAVAWLRTSGAPLPQRRLHILQRSGMTVIGGTGLCCFSSLSIVYWEGNTREPFVGRASSVMYIADAGIVVQADIRGLPDGPPFGFSAPCTGRTHMDQNGVAIGTWCFSYPGAVHHLIVGEIANHQSWVDDPRQLVTLLSGGAHASHPPTGPRRRIALSSTVAVFEEGYRGTTYRITLQPAFPGLVGSPWEETGIRRMLK